MKKSKEILTDKKLSQMLKAYLRSTGDLVPKYPEEVRAFEKRKLETPDFLGREEDPMEILRQGYIPYELTVKIDPRIVSEPVGLSMCWAARNGIDLSEDTIMKIMKEMDEEDSSSPKP